MERGRGAAAVLLSSAYLRNRAVLYYCYYYYYYYYFTRYFSSYDLKKNIETSKRIKRLNLGWFLECEYELKIF